MSFGNRQLTAFLTFLSFLPAGGDTVAKERQTLAPFEAYRPHALPLAADAEVNRRIEQAGKNRLVLLGESTHGTREFYTWRDRISRHLIENAGFSFVAVEGDWVSLARLNRYVKHLPDAAGSAREALIIADRWPRWMWANLEFEAFAEWLREFNRQREPRQRVGIYGMDVYSTWAAMDTVMAWYAENHPEKLATVRERYASFGQFRDNPHNYARRIAAGGADAAEGVAKVADKTKTLWEKTDEANRKAAFFAKQAARVVEAGEGFYRLMARQGAESWNARAVHMHETVNRLLEYHGADGKGIVWAHNTHIGDARATTMAAAGQHNIGRLARETHGPDKVFAIGFTTWKGEVTAARQWGGKRENLPVPAALENSLEGYLKGLAMGDVLVAFPPVEQLPEGLRSVVGNRAIGVVYNPARERMHYVPTIPALRYNAIIYIEETSPLTPMHDQE